MKSHKAGRMAGLLLAAAWVLWLPGGGSRAQLAEGFVNFSFDEVDVPAFARLVGEITGRKMVVDDSVKGKITVVSPRVSRDQVYPLFVTILESAGCSVVEEGGLHRIVALPERSTPLAPVVGPEEQTPGAGVFTKVFRLSHVPAAELERMLRPKVAGGKGGSVAALEETNHLIVTDTASSIRGIEKMIAEIDREGQARVTEVVALKFAAAEELADQLSRAVAESLTRGERQRNRLPSVRDSTAARQAVAIVASPHSNSLVLVGTAAQIAGLRKIIAQMDVDSPTGRLNAIFLKHTEAEEAAKSIGALLDKSRPAAGAAGARRPMAIEASVANNALLVDASPADFDLVRRLVEQLDQPREQVHIQVLIAEVSHSDSLNFGVEFAAVEMPSRVGSTVLQGGSRFLEGADTLMNAIQDGVFPMGLTVGAAHGSSVKADGSVAASYPAILNVNAIKKDSRFKVVSETALETQNNREASVNIVNEIPILKSTVEGIGDNREVVQNIDRIEVGIKLKLIPHVIPGGQVQMELNPSIEAVIDPGPAGTQFAPTIARREVATTVTVGDGRMIVIAGLTRRDKTEVMQKTPLLGSIPLLGLLFRNVVEAVETTNLLIFVTPRVVSDPAAAGRVMSEWREKTGLEDERD